jgi:hypothetical protein
MDMDLSFFTSPSCSCITIGILIFLAILLPKLYPLFIHPRPIDRWTGKPISWIHLFTTYNFLLFASYWNNYKSHNDSSITSNTLLIGYHTRSTFDNLYVLASIQPSFIASYFLFHIPFISQVFEFYNAISSKGLNSTTTDHHFIQLLLHDSRPVLVLPGGSYEAYKPYEEIDQIDWKDEPGFARLLVNYSKEYPALHEINVIPFYTKNGDEIFFHHRWWYSLTSRYAREALLQIRHGNYFYLFNLMFFGGLGLGFLLFPKPIPLETFYGHPLKLKRNETAKEFGKRVQHELQSLINQVNQNRGPAQGIKNGRRRGGGRGGGRNGRWFGWQWWSSILQKGYGILFGVYMFLQNLCFALFAGFLTILAVPMFLTSAIFSQGKKKKTKEVKTD